MSEPLIVTESVRVPASAMSVRAVRSSGPGGQNVNKVATKIDLRVDLEGIEGLADDARARLRALAHHRLDREGRLVVTSQASRNQARNLEDARAKVRTLVTAALAPPRPRRRSRPPAAARERRRATKKLRASLKRARAKPDDRA